MAAIPLHSAVFSLLLAALQVASTLERPWTKQSIVLDDLPCPLRSTCTQPLFVNQTIHHYSTMCYSKSELFKYNTGTSVRLSSGVWNSIKALGINKQKPTRRGKKKFLLVETDRNLIQCNESLVQLNVTNSTTSTELSYDSNLSFCLWNAHSVRNKTTMCSDFVLERDMT